MAGSENARYRSVSHRPEIGRQRKFGMRPLPPDEKFNLVQQIRRAALSVKLNIAEGSSRKSEIERKRFWEISRGSVIELDAAAETIVDLKNLNESELAEMGALINSAFALLTKMTKG